MSSESYFWTSVPITRLYTILQRHVIIFNPPYDINAILSESREVAGSESREVAGASRIKITIEHSTRHIDLSYVSRPPSVSTLVTETMVNVFRSHRLQAPIYTPTIDRPVPYGSPYQIIAPCPDPVGQQTGQLCSICIEPICSGNLRVLQCAHLFHNACIERWALVSRSPSCPVCRTSLT